jgi:hypothetical protein
LIGRVIGTVIKIHKTLKFKTMGGEQLVVAIVALISIFGTISGIAYLFFATRNRERLALINKGADASIFEINPQQGANDALKFGLTAIGVGIGIFLTGCLAQYSILDNNAGKFALPLIFGGIGLIIYYKIMKDKN